MIKVVSIDFWNTIVNTQNGEKRRELRLNRFLEVCKKYNPEISSDQIETAIKDSIKWFEKIWEDEHRTVLSIDIIQFILNNLKLNLEKTDMESTVKIFEKGVLEAEPELAIGVKNALEVLSENYKLAIISDTHFSPGIILRQLLEQKGVLRYFSAFSFSDEIGVSKPHTKMYQNIMEKSDCRFTEMIHIGDMVRTDINGAKSFGIKSILYTGINNSDSGSGIADFEVTDWQKIPDLLTQIR